MQLIQRVVVHPIAAVHTACGALVAHRPVGPQAVAMAMAVAVRHQYRDDVDVLVVLVMLVMVCGERQGAVGPHLSRHLTKLGVVIEESGGRQGRGRCRCCCCRWRRCLWGRCGGCGLVVGLLGVTVGAVGVAVVAGRPRVVTRRTRCWRTGRHQLDEWRFAVVSRAQWRGVAIQQCLLNRRGDDPAVAQLMCGSVEVALVWVAMGGSVVEAGLVVHAAPHECVLLPGSQARAHSKHATGKEAPHKHLQECGPLWAVGEKAHALVAAERRSWVAVHTQLLAVRKVVIE
mmetsp:Transcript_36884/g.92487  ORF Transcript_36884/g.92487 Transcript_36884/m.92487 type:complete len:287 (+) Transcript_36884:478-1338(+)